MNRPFESECATVLDKSLRGENMLHLRIFSKEEGLALLLKKIPSNKSAPLPDFFDDISVSGEYGKVGNLKFMRSHELLNSRCEIAKDFDAFNNASQIVNIVLQNGANIENANILSTRLRNSLDALKSKSAPSVVHLKFLYLLVRDEGYPIHQQFYSKLSAENIDFFTLLIRTPSAQLQDLRSRADELLEKLRSWTEVNTDIIL